MRELWLLDDGRIYGGGQRNVLTLSRFAEAELPDWLVRVACPSTSELAERCRGVGIEVVHATFPDLRAASGLRILRAVRHLRRLFSDTSEALIVGASLRAQVYAHAAASGLSLPLRIVHLMSEQDSARRLTTRVLLRRYGGVVVVGDRAAQAYRARIPGVVVRSVNNFLLPEEVLGARRVPRPPYDGRPLALGLLARLIPEKGVLELVGELGESREAWSTLLVGGDRQDERHAREIEARTAQFGLTERVHLAGRVDDLDAFFEEIDALVVPSIGNEGQPTVIIEALAHGRPVIVREALWSEAFAGLPVLPYRDANELRDILAGLEPAGVDPRDLSARFSPSHVIEAIESAATDGR